MVLQRRMGITLLVLQLLLILMFSFQLDYGNPTASDLSKYPMFMDMHLMLLVGFGFIMTFLRRYGYSSIAFNFLLCAVVLQWGLLVLSLFDGWGGQKMTFISVINADVLLATVLISFGCVLGKTSPLQLVLMALLEAPIYALNAYIGDKILKVPDPGGSVIVHVFGAYFGLAVSKVLGKPKSLNLESSSYNSDLFSMLGTLVLWVYWPSFNSILSTSDEQYRSIINTLLSLAGSCIAAFAISSLTDNNKKITMAHIQNATLAGGVAIGSVCTLVVHPYGALTIGLCGGVLVTLGYKYVQGWLQKRVGLHDTCGVHNLHALPGIFSGILSAILATTATQEVYGPRLYLTYTARAPEPFTAELKDLHRSLTLITPGDNRSALSQGGFQILGLVLTIFIALVSGSLTGIILKLTSPWTGSVPEEYTHNDELYWNLEGEEPKKTRPALDIETVSSNTLNVA